jgi:hypothetical protein
MSKFIKIAAIVGIAALAIAARTLDIAWMSSGWKTPSPQRGMLVRTLHLRVPGESTLASLASDHPAAPVPVAGRPIMALSSRISERKFRPNLYGCRMSQGYLLGGKGRWQT